MKQALSAVLLIVFVCVTPGLSQAINFTYSWDWFCNGINEGADGSVTATLNKNGTFTDSLGGYGTWGTRLVNGKGIGFLSFDLGCFPLYTIDLTTGEIIFDCRDGATLGPNGWPNAKDYSCGKTRALNRLLADPAVDGMGDPSGSWLGK